MKKTNYTDQSKQNLLKALGEKREALRKLRFESSGSKVRNVKGGASTRKDIARIMTVLNKSQ
jgi:ribosomal protein L29